MESLYEKDVLQEPFLDNVDLIDEDRLSLRKQQSRSQISTTVLLLLVTNILTLLLLFVNTLRSSMKQDNFCEADLNPWGEPIPFRNVVWEEDVRFVNDRPKVEYNDTWGYNNSIWGTIFPSAWVEVNPTPGGGVPLPDWGSEEEEWASTSEAWPLTLMHQLHCLSTMKTTAQRLELGVPVSHELLGHFPHCIEYLRQSVMCTADLTLELPMKPLRWPIGTTGWGNTHRCRDWPAVLDAITKHSLLRGDGKKWVRLQEKEKE